MNHPPLATLIDDVLSNNPVKVTTLSDDYPLSLLGNDVLAVNRVSVE
jgi:hypothetical protein